MTILFRRSRGRVFSELLLKSSAAAKIAELNDVSLELLVITLPPTGQNLPQTQNRALIWSERGEWLSSSGNILWDSESLRAWRQIHTWISSCMIQQIVLWLNLFEFYHLELKSLHWFFNQTPLVSLTFFSCILILDLRSVASSWWLRYYDQGTYFFNVHCLLQVP